MRKFILLASVAVLCSCGGGKSEAEKTEAASSKIRCDSIETVSIDSVTGTQTFLKVWRCDSGEVTK